MKVSHALIALAAVITAGCDLATQSDLERLEHKIDAVRFAEQVTNGQLNELSRQVQNLPAQDALPKIAAIDPASSQGYSIIDARVSPALIIFEGAFPHADGSRAVLRIGNPSAATMTGGAVFVRYGSRFSGNAEEYAAWAEGLRSSSASIVTPINWGAWGTIAVPLPGIKPDDLGHLEVRMAITQVSLR